MSSIAARSFQFVPSSAPPSTLAQWRVALQELKLLYFQKQYKRCVARSSSLLSEAKEPVNPIHKTYLHFYSAISYEAMGRYAHEYSSKKVPLLREALDSFGDCLATLPAFVSEDTFGLGDGPGFEEFDEAYADAFGIKSAVETYILEKPLSDFPSPYPSLSPSTAASRSLATSPTESIFTSITDIIERTLDCTDDDPFLSDYEVLSQVELEVDSDDRPMFEDDDEHENEVESDHNLIPSPLQVRKPSTPLDSVFRSAKSNDNSDSLARLHSFTVHALAEQPNALSSPCTVVPRLSLNSESTASLGSASKKTYNASLKFLHGQVTSTIDTLHTLIAEVTATQHARAAHRRSFQRSVSFWSFSPVEGNTRSSPGLQQQHFPPKGGPIGESKQERIARLRSEGWKTVGLKNTKRGWKGEEYYREFCAMALDELYLD
ncbi:hypothetical protein BDV18DRAFT_110156 [Aspergillus unguis]